MTKKRSTMIEKNQILELLFELLPYVFWKDKTGKYLGSNENQAKNLGFKSPDEFIGKSIYEILDDQESAKRIDDIDQMVMRHGTLIEEEKMVTPNGVKIFSSQKSPILDDQNTIIGMIGFSMDVTEVKQREEYARKEKERLEAERLRTENESKRRQLEIQDQFVKTANQVAHDIRSPLASLLMIVNACKEIPERERIALRAASTRISDIANNLLSHYRVDNKDISSEHQGKRPILLSAVLLQLLTEKKFQYHENQVKFDIFFGNEAQFSFVLVEDSDFKRMLSNLINNAVEACSGMEKAYVDIGLEVKQNNCIVTVSDNGKGMSHSLIDKIMNNMVVTEGKIDGSGIGLTQVRETLIRNEGSFCIHSKEGQGSTFQLTFPLIKAPDWIAERIIINEHSMVIILDDDNSIHGAWDSKLATIVSQSQPIKIHHFEKGHEALSFLKTLTQSEKQSTLLLTDYELLNEDINGLDVIEEIEIKGSIVVTSHYENPDIQQRAVNLGAKILPKQLASEIIIEINKPKIEEKKSAESCETIHAILIDDDEVYINNVLLYQFDDDESILHFKQPEELMDYLKQHPNLSRNIKICTDNHFDNSEIKGKDFVKNLHELGFSNLFLVSGTQFNLDELPPYLKILDKSEIGQIKDW